LRVDNFEGATSQNGGLVLSERWTQLLRNREKQEREIHCRECKEASWGLHAVASKVGNNANVCTSEECVRYDAQRPRCAALKKARSAAAQTSVTNALLGDIRTLWPVVEQPSNAGYLALGDAFETFMAVKPNAFPNACAVQFAPHLIKEHHHPGGQLAPQRQRLVGGQRISVLIKKVGKDVVELVGWLVLRIGKCPPNTVECRRDASALRGCEYANNSLEVVWYVV
jgi:hypothetical protein